MIWDNFVNDLKIVFGSTDKKEWLDKLIENLEKQRFEDINLPFKIIKIKEKGFVVKVSGLFAFISFNHMPWKYYDIDSWVAISPKLIDKVFFCKIHKFNKDPLSIIVNGDLPQFKKTELIVGEEYIGVIIKKLKYGIIVDIGCHFNWKCGSLVGLMHKSQFRFKDSFLNCTIGDEIQLCYQRLNEDEQFIFSQNTEIKDWNSGKPQELIGKTVWVRVVRNPDGTKIGFLVNEKYKGNITLLKKDYTPKYRRIISEAKRKLSDGEIINCEVTGFSERKMSLELRWIVELDTEMLIQDSIINKLDKNSLEKMIEKRNEIIAYNKLE